MKGGSWVLSDPKKDRDGSLHSAPPLCVSVCVPWPNQARPPPYSTLSRQAFNPITAHYAASQPKPEPRSPNVGSQHPRPRSPGHLDVPCTQAPGTSGGGGGGRGRSPWSGGGGRERARRHQARCGYEKVPSRRSRTPHSCANPLSHIVCKATRLFCQATLRTWHEWRRRSAAWSLALVRHSAASAKSPFAITCHAEPHAVCVEPASTAHLSVSGIDLGTGGGGGPLKKLGLVFRF